jgi:pathogenesis-related protein 1
VPSMLSAKVRCLACALLVGLAACATGDDPGGADAGGASAQGGAGGVGKGGAGGMGGTRGTETGGSGSAPGTGGNPGSGGDPSVGSGGSGGTEPAPDSGSTAEPDAPGEDTNHAPSDAPVIRDGSAADAPRADMRTPDAPVAPSGEPARLAGMTQAHNDARATIPVPPLTWDPDLAAIAQAYAEKCVFQHSGHQGLGENLAAYYPPGHKAADAVEDWVGEKVDYDYATNKCAPNKVCGHYTQVVWKNSTRVGCGVATCNQNSPFGPKYPGAWENWVCNYTPPGNYIGQKPY